MELFMARPPWNMGLGDGSGEGSGGGLGVLQENVIGVWPLTANGNDTSPNALHWTESIISGSISYGANGVSRSAGGESNLVHALAGALAIGDNNFVLSCEVSMSSGASMAAINYSEYDGSVMLGGYDDAGTKKYLVALADSELNYTDLRVTNATFNTLRHCLLWYDKAADLVYLSVNGAAATSYALVGGLAVPAEATNIYITLTEGQYLRNMVLWKGANVLTNVLPAASWLKDSFNGEGGDYAALGEYP